MDSVINMDKLIKVVQSHRMLYDLRDVEYFNRNKRKQTWQEVCSVLHPAWDTIDKNEKLLYEKEVMKKWMSLRDCFRRELQNSKIPNKTRKKYKHFDDLEFLTPHVLNPAGNTEQDGGNGSMGDSDTSKDPVDNIKINRKRKSSIVDSDDDDEEIIPTKEINEGNASREERDVKRYVDDDEAFLWSLMPVFKECTLNQKIMLRIELMKTMLKFKESQNMVTMPYEVNYDEHFEVSVKLEH